MGRETQLTSGPGGRILTNCNVWSPDGNWIVYDTRSDAAGDVFDGNEIQIVNVRTRQVRTLYWATNGACCGVATWHPRQLLVAFILGPEHPTPDWIYGPARRQGVQANADLVGEPVSNLDARDLTPPFTPGALRGGTHVHVWNPVGNLVSFTYEDHVLATNPGGELNQRNVGVTRTVYPLRVPRTHPRNHDGLGFSVLVTRTVNDPRPGSDDISRAFEEGWVGNRALAFQGHVRTAAGDTISEALLVDLPDDLTVPGDGPLEGTLTRRPCPPRGTVQRRLTRTEGHRFPGLSGPRHWLRASPDGSRIGFLKKDDDGIVQFWTVTPAGDMTQATRNPFPVASAFTWHPDGRRVAFVMDNSVCLTDVDSGQTVRLTPRSDDAPRPEACVVSPDGSRIAFVRRLPWGQWECNQICVVEVD